MIILLIFAGIEFKDEVFGNHYETGPDVIISNKVRREIINEIRKYLPLSKESGF